MPPAEAYGVATLLRAVRDSSRGRRRSCTSATTSPARAAAAPSCVAELERTVGPAGARRPTATSTWMREPVPRPVRAGAGGAGHARRARPRRAAPIGPATVGDVVAALAGGAAPESRREPVRPRRGRAAAAAPRSAASTRRASTTTARTAATRRCARALELGPAGVIREVTDVEAARAAAARRFPTGRKWEAVARDAGAAALPGLQRRRVRARHLQGSRADGGRPVRGGRGDDDRRRSRPAASSGYLYIRGEYPLAAERLQHAIAQARARGLLGDDVMGVGAALRHRDPPRRRRLHLRRGDGAVQLDRGQARRAAQQAAVPGRVGPVRQADGRQQRRDAGQRARHRARGRRGVRQRSAREQSTGHAAVLPVGLRRAARPLRGAVRRHAARAARRWPAASPAAGRCRRCCSAAPPATFVGPDELDIAADVRGHARRRRHARLRRRAWCSTTRVDLRDTAAAHRRVLPRRVVRPVRAVPRRHRAPGGGAAAPARRQRPRRQRRRTSWRCSTSSRRRCATRRSAASARPRPAPIESAISEPADVFEPRGAA